LNSSAVPAGASRVSTALTSTYTVADAENLPTYALTSMSPAIGASSVTRPKLSTRERSSLSTVQAARISPSKQPGGSAVTVN
jgi:hypothetical protein